MKKHLHDYIDDSKTHNVRGLRILLEYFYALEEFEEILEDDSKHVVSVFGSARTQPGHPEYEDARKLGKLLYDKGFSVITGGSQGIMRAANEGAVDGIVAELKKKKKYKSLEKLMASKEFAKLKRLNSLGLKISLPFEEKENVALGTVATFHYFMVRKFFFANLSSAFIACEGGWGTRDELFEVLTLVQTGKTELMPIVYVSPDPAHIQNDVKYALKTKCISPDDVHLLQIVKDYKKAAQIVEKFYKVVKKISYDSKPDIEIYTNKPLTKVQQSKVQKIIDGKYKAFFDGVEFFKTKFVLKNFKIKSYGKIRVIIDAIS